MLTRNNLLIDNRSKYERLLDLYLSGDFPKETLIDHKSRLERTIQSLEMEQASLRTQVNKGLTLEQEEQIKDFASQLGRGLLIADSQFQIRRQVVELLNVTATLTRENGQKVAYVSCALGENMFELKTNRSNGTGSNSGGSLQIAFNSFGEVGLDRFPH